MIIKNIKGREILDSRGNPTVEVDVILENGIIGRASVPSGASTGVNEALELRDKDERYNGLGVKTAINNINTIIKDNIVGMDVVEQLSIDKKMIELDGTLNKSKLGANAILGVSLAVLKAASISKGVSLYKYVNNTFINEEMSLPIQMVNIINGGAHADNKLDFQEYMIIPNKKTMAERVRVSSEVFHSLKKVLKNNNLITSVGDEGGFAPDLNNNKEALDLIMIAIKEAGYIPGTDVNLALDVAASEFYLDGKYNLVGEGRVLTSEELIFYYEELINKYPIISIEDPVDENDWEGFKLITERLGSKIQIVGDDLFVTNKLFLQKGIDSKAGNTILIKLNQIGTFSETLETIKLAKDNNYKTIISHRSGETEDSIISDLSVGLNIGQIKTGSVSRTERVCKYNQLLRIEEYLTY